MKSISSLPVIRHVENLIFIIRGQKVMLDHDLARLYGVETFNLNKAVKRNIERFPVDFMFQLNGKETDFLRFQNGMSKPSGRGGRRYLPYVFTEQGVAMLSSVLRSSRAVQVNIEIMRAFVRLRVMIAGNKKLAAKLAELERKIDYQGKDIRTLFAAIRELMNPPEPPPRRITGFGKPEN